MTVNQGYKSNNASPEEQNPPHGWPRRMYRLLAIVGVLAFSLIIIDRIASIFRTEDSTRIATAPLSDDSPSQEGMTPIVRSDTTLEDQFGSPVLFVSTAGSKYLLTAEDQRFVIGEAVKDNVVLADITDEQIILKKQNEIIAYDLAELAGQ